MRLYRPWGDFVSPGGGAILIFKENQGGFDVLMGTQGW